MELGDKKVRLRVLWKEVITQRCKIALYTVYSLKMQLDTCSWWELNLAPSTHPTNAMSTRLEVILIQCQDFWEPIHGHYPWSGNSPAVFTVEVAIPILCRLSEQEACVHGGVLGGTALIATAVLLKRVVAVRQYLQISSESEKQDR